MSNKESTPFAILDVKLTEKQMEKLGGPVWARFYWTAKAGMYGVQVICEYNAGKGFKTYRTNGCGYCKKAASLEHFYNEVFKKYNSLGGDLDYYVPRKKSMRGGNQFDLTLKQFENIRTLRD